MNLGRENAMEGEDEGKKQKQKRCEKRERGEIGEKREEKKRGEAEINVMLNEEK